MVDAYTLSVGKSLSCISCFNSSRNGSNNNSWKGYEEIPASWITRFKHYAKKKNNCFEITPEDVWKLYLNQKQKCALTGLDISFKKVGKAVYTASIDRIDSSKGYITDNIQLVHKDVNMMKNAFDQTYFIELCKAVAKNHS
jgi:hypothetical protein